MAADEDEAKGSGTADGMRGQPDDKATADRRTSPRQRPPVTIDLTAEEAPAKAESAAKPEPAKSKDPAEPSGPSARRRESEKAGAGAQAFRSAAARALVPDDGSRRSALAGIAGGLVALIVVILLQAIGVLPAPGRSAANQAIEQSKTAADASSALDRRLTAVEAMTESIPEMRTEIRSLGDRVAALEGGRGTLATRSEIEAVATNVAALGEKIASAPPAATGEEIAGLTERIARVEVAAATSGGGDGVSNQAIASLTSQLANAETQVRSLTDRISAAEAKVASSSGPVADGESALRAVAIAALRRAADGDKPFASDVDLVSALGVAGDQVATLRPIAEKGVAAGAALAAEFPAVSGAILSATSASDPNAGFWQRVKDGLSSLVAIRPTGPIAGGDPVAIVSRMVDAVSKGDLATALAEREALPQAGKQASAEWAAKAADRVALDALVERIARAFDAPNAG